MQLKLSNNAETMPAYKGAISFNRNSRTRNFLVVACLPGGLVGWLVGGLGAGAVGSAGWVGDFMTTPA